MSFNCTDQFDQIYLEQDGHGDYWPSCTTSTSFVTPRPTVQQPQAPCGEWDSLISDADYAHSVELAPDTYFLWNVVDAQLDGKMLHRGRVGWMAIGIENLGGHHNGMNGGPIVMGLNDEENGLSVGEFRIHEERSAWRNWQTALSPTTLAEEQMEVTACISWMKFRTTAGTIHGEPLNLTVGGNRMIWALTHNAYVTREFGGYAAYHASVDRDRNLRPNFRGKVHLDLSQGEEVATSAPALGPDGSLESSTSAEMSEVEAEDESSNAATRGVVHAIALAVCLRLCRA